MYVKVVCVTKLNNLFDFFRQQNPDYKYQSEN